MSETVINPGVSKLGFKAYTYAPQAAPPDTQRGRRGARGDGWFRPSLVSFARWFDGSLGLQDYSGELLSGAEYGHHYYSHPKALDFFYARQGHVLVALAALDGSYQELYYLAEPTVVIFPPFVPHLVRNCGARALAFTGLKTWNYPESGTFTRPYLLRLDADLRAQAQRRPLCLPDGKYGFSDSPQPDMMGVERD